MTIKEFARLCDCNPQTLRYYDGVDLLKPAKVDGWTGYRYYEEEQALAFVKIKNLQKAGFTIEEIKELLDKDNSVICRAFEAKIAEGERRLQEIREIQRSYQSEMSEIQKKIQETKEEIMASMQQFDPRQEFGIDQQEYDQIVGSIEQMFRELAVDPPQEIGYEKYCISDAPAEEEKYRKILQDPTMQVVYENHGWGHVREFLADVSRLESGEEYALCFLVDDEKDTYNMAFANTILGVLLARNPGKKLNLSCDVENTRDGQNHFWLLQRKK
ncbi:MAG: MerR family transcriptional regulator [Oscillospiraceae bacterium]|jgi:DNA-binding transcriptional MerR regulator|nr:MerR family transcriptional regulator [Oscillospiraceae bacterium]